MWNDSILHDALPNSQGRYGAWVGMLIPMTPSCRVPAGEKVELEELRPQGLISFDTVQCPNVPGGGLQRYREGTLLYSLRVMCDFPFFLPLFDADEPVRQ